MRLLGTPTSPYVRKVRVVAAELGLGDRLVFEPVVIADNPPALSANPMRKVPTLIADDGTAIFDSPVIMEWLDAEHGNGRLLAKSGPHRWAALTANAMADGILEAGGLVRTERLKPEADQNAGIIRRQTGKVQAVLERVETDAAWRSGPSIDLGQIAIGVAIGWLHFRLPDLAPAVGGPYPGLAAWYETLARRPSMIATAPPPA